MRAPYRSLASPHRDAFTLVEVLLAMAVASLLMVTLLSILSKSMDVSKRANTEILSKSSAQAALDVMQTDLSSLLVSRNAGQVFVWTNQTVSGAPGLNPTPASIFLLTTSMEDSYSTNPGGSNAGVPRLVQYAILYTNSYASQTNAFGLYRNVLDPTNTFNSAIGGQNLTTNTGLSNNLLVPNVVGMTCNLYTNYGAGVWSNAGTTNAAIYSTNFPTGVVVEISLTVLDEGALARFGNGSGKGNNSSTNLIKQYGRTLIRRVSLPSPP
jgi:prepilin-type N-terminal cleavage/methylation domain-containing protein